jgi:hypothetical protein
MQSTHINGQLKEEEMRERIRQCCASEPARADLQNDSTRADQTVLIVIMLDILSMTSDFNCPDREHYM